MIDQWSRPSSRIALHDYAILEALQGAGMGDTDLNQVFRLAAERRERLLSETERSTALVELVEKAILTDEGVRLGLNIPVACAGPSGAPLRKALNLFRFVPLKVKRRGVEMRLIINGGDEPRKPDPALLKAFARARGWFEELASGRVGSLVEIARREGLAKRYVTRLTKLAFVSPAFAEAIAKGEVPTSTNLQMLMDGRIAPPLAGTIRSSFSATSRRQQPIRSQTLSRGQRDEFARRSRQRISSYGAFAKPTGRQRESGLMVTNPTHAISRIVGNSGPPRSRYGNSDRRLNL